MTGALAQGNLKEAQTKEIKNGRLAMVAFAGFTLQVRRLQAFTCSPTLMCTRELMQSFYGSLCRHAEWKYAQLSGRAAFKF